MTTPPLDELFRQFYHLTVPPEMASTYSIGLVITLYNRPEYLKRTLDSLSQSALPDTVVMLIDDASDDPATLSLINDYCHPHAPILKVERVSFSAEYHRPATINQNLLFGWSYLARHYQTAYLCNLDADMIVKPDWLTRIVDIYHKVAQHERHFLLSGFNTPEHGMVKLYHDYYQKLSLGGANLFFSCETLAEITHAGRAQIADEKLITWDWIMIKHLVKQGYSFYAVRPSVMQHIGDHGVNSRPFYYDFALDYYFPHPSINAGLWRLMLMCRTLATRLAIIAPGRD